MELFKIIPLDDYNKFIKVGEFKKFREESCLDQEISELPKLLQRKVKKLLDCLTESGITVVESGRAESLDQSVLPYIVCALKGKDRPSDWSSFALLLINCKLPKDLLCEKASVELKRAKRNAKKINSD